MTEEFRARLHPQQNASRFTIKCGTMTKPRLFLKSRDWYEVDRATALDLANIYENTMNPEGSPRVFQVMRLKEAKALEERTKFVEDPRGTVDNPVPMNKKKPVLAAPEDANGILDELPPEPAFDSESNTSGDITLEELTGEKETPAERKARAKAEREEADSEELEEPPVAKPIKRAGRRKKKKVASK